jgi:hypothetical protein
MRVVCFGLTVLLLCSTAGGQMRSPAPEARHTQAGCPSQGRQTP